MDAEIVRLARLAVSGDWEALALLLDRLEENGDPRRKGLMAVLAGVADRLERSSRAGMVFPPNIARALGDARRWLRLEFWAELYDGGPKALFARMKALEEAHGCDEGPHALMEAATAPAAEDDLRRVQEQIRRHLDEAAREEPIRRRVGPGLRLAQDGPAPEPREED